MPFESPQAIALAGITSEPRVHDSLATDTLSGFGTVANPVDLANHLADFGNPDDGSAAWEKHPNSVGLLRGVLNNVTNSSGSAAAIYRFRRDPGTVDYRVEADFKISTLAVGGNASYVMARLDDALDTGYYGLFNFNSTTNFTIALGKMVTGTSTTLGTSLVLSGAAMPAVGETWSMALSVSNDEKVLYLKRPTGSRAGQWERVTSSGDNTINAAGWGGLRMLRSNNTTGASPIAWRLIEGGPQEPSGTSIVGTPDPIQSAQTLFRPSYTTATNTMTGLGGTHVGTTPSPWKSSQDPFVRGVRQDARSQIVANADVPGNAQSFAPSGGAFRAELRAFSNSNITVTATASATSTATTLTMSSGDVSALFDKDWLLNNRTGEHLRVNGTPSGTSVPVLRAQSTTAAAINNADTFLVPGGDVSDSGGTYMANRVEMFDRFPDGGGSTAPAAWPDPVGSVRWYRVLVYVDPSNSGYGSGKWTVLDQWKGQFGGSPPRALELSSDGNSFELGGTRTRLSLGSSSPGTWVKFVFGFRWETDAVNGWVQVYRNNSLIVPKRHEATLDYKFNKPANGADPIYYKQGIYRTTGHTATHIYYFGEPIIGTTLADVDFDH